MGKIKSKKRGGTGNPRSWRDNDSDPPIKETVFRFKFQMTIPPRRDQITNKSQFQITEIIRAKALSYVTQPFRAEFRNPPLSSYRPKRFLNSCVSMGTTLKRSPTIPKVAILKIGASASLLMATMISDVFIPA